ncbi:MAG: transposase [Phycisphaerae bacterium]|nr:transposase [Phycisphaerae bacterium]
MLNGIFWILRTGSPWADLPERYPSSKGLGMTSSLLSRALEAGTLRKAFGTNALRAHSSCRSLDCPLGYARS